MTEPTDLPSRSAASDRPGRSAASDLAPDGRAALSERGVPAVPFPPDVAHPASDVSAPSPMCAPDVTSASDAQPAPASPAARPVPGAPVPPAGFAPAGGAPHVPGAPVPPTPRGAVANVSAGVPDDSPRSAFETARAAVENIPGLDDISIRQLDAIEPGPHRASPLSFIPTSLKIIPSFFAVFVVMMIQMPRLFAESGGDLMPLLIAALSLVGLLALAAIMAVVSWRIHTWELEDDALVLRRKFITSTEKRIPYQRVHSIDLNAGLFSRLLGLVDVSVGTGTAVAEKIDGLKRSDAEVLKRTVFARKELLGKAAAARAAVRARGEASGFELGADAALSVSAALAALRAAGDALATSAIPLSGCTSGRLDSQVGSSGPLACEAGTGGAAQAGSRPDGRPSDAAGAPAGGAVRADGASGSASGAYDDVLAPDHVDHETRLTRRQYVLGALTSPNINGLIVSLAGFVAGLFSLMDYAADFFGEQIVYGLLGTGAEITADTAAQALGDMGPGLAGAIGGVLLVVLLVVWAASAVLSLIKWGNFVARRRGDRVEVSWGLLSRNTRAVELGRVQYVSVEQSLIRRIAGYARIVAHTVSVSSGEDASSLEAGVVVHPFVRLSEADAWLSDMLPEFSGIVGAAPELDRLPRRALRRTLLRGLYWSLACAAVAVAPTILREAGVFAASAEGGAAWLLDAGIAALWALTAFVLVWGEIVRVLAWRRRRIGTDGHRFVMRDGALGTTISASPRTKAQALVVSQSPFQRGARVATVRMNTAGAGGDLRLRDASTDTADRLLDWTRPHYHNEKQVARALADAGLAS